MNLFPSDFGDIWDVSLTNSPQQPMRDPLLPDEPKLFSFDFDPPSAFDDTFDFSFGAPDFAIPRGPVHRRTPTAPIALPIPSQNHKEAIKSRPVRTSDALGTDEVFKVRHNRRLSAPTQTNILTADDSAFSTLLSDADVRFNPQAMGFIPVKYWPSQEFSFGELVYDFFQRKNNSNCRFSHKLFNALRITRFDPFYFEYTGVEWLNEKVLKVDKKKFARLLGIKSIDGSLFHQQGNFPSHGFAELTCSDAAKYCTQDELVDIDFDNVRLLIHIDGVFTRDSSENDIEECKWVSARNRNKV